MKQQSRVAKRRTAGIASAKILIASASVAATLGGWAVISATADPTTGVASQSAALIAPSEAGSTLSFPTPTQTQSAAFAPTQLPVQAAPQLPATPDSVALAPTAPTATPEPTAIPQPTVTPAPAQPQPRVRTRSSR